MPRRGRTLSQGPFPTPPEMPGGGKPPNWWPEWMPWIDVDAWQKIFSEYTRFATEGQPTTTSPREMLTSAADIVEDWAARARKALEERMRR